MGIEVFPITTIVPVTTYTYRAETFISGQGINAPVSPVVVHETQVGISLSNEGNNVLFVLEHAIYGSCTKGILFQHITRREDRQRNCANQRIFHKLFHSIYLFAKLQ